MYIRDEELFDWVENVLPVENKQIYFILDEVIRNQTLKSNTLGKRFLKSNKTAKKLWKT